jgi:hypothetical protein
MGKLDIRGVVPNIGESLNRAKLNNLARNARLIGV